MNNTTLKQGFGCKWRQEAMQLYTYTQETIQHYTDTQEAI
jgi:hypothetical protein